MLLMILFSICLVLATNDSHFFGSLCFMLMLHGTIFNDNLQRNGPPNQSNPPKAICITNRRWKLFRVTSALNFANLPMLYVSLIN